MAKTKSQQDQPGNDGAWFVEAVAPPSASTESGNGDAAPITETTLQLEPFEAWPLPCWYQKRMSGRGVPAPTNGGKSSISEASAS